MLKITASKLGYVFEVEKMDTYAMSLLNRLVSTNRGLEFVELEQIPDFVIKGNPVAFGDVEIIPQSTRTIAIEQRIEWLISHGYEFDPNSGTVQQSGFLVPVGVVFDGHRAVTYMIPRVPIDTEHGRVRGAMGKIDSSGMFTGVVSYDESN